MDLRRTLVSLLLATSLLGVGAPAVAGDDAPAADKRAAVEARLKQLRRDMLRKEVGLSDAQATKVEAVLDQLQPERDRLTRRLHQHRQTLKQLLAKDSDDQAAYTAAINGLRDAQHKLHLLRQKEFDAVRQHLTPKQQAKFVRALHRMHKALRKSLRAYYERDD
ncbi:MAG TPA: periplasmic heavy metal sensor [Polyangiaceae bacterium]|nr:periplasmic heavy metal sensor [Polyangiaceae bacterium]